MIIVPAIFQCALGDDETDKVILISALRCYIDLLGHLVALQMLASSVVDFLCVTVPSLVKRTLQ